MLQPRPYQLKAIDDVRARYAAGDKSVVLVLPTGSGKCLGIGTPVLLYSGMIVPAESVRPGDRLIGPDGGPRLVLSSTRGVGQLYEISPIKGDPWVCNDVHVLSLVNSETGEIIDIDLQSYLKTNQWFKHLHKQFTPVNGIDFSKEEILPLDPYFLGVWYGDGTKALNGVAITKPDQEIIDLCHNIARKFGMTVRTESIPGRCPVHHITSGTARKNPLLTLLREVTEFGTHFPHIYLTASRENRLQFMAGILDTDGYMNNGGFEIVQKQKGFSEGVCFLARSLGMRALMVPKIVNGDTYWRVSISGDCSIIPNRIPRKKAAVRRQIKSPTRTGFSISEIGIGEYAGFELDGDGRFLLGDFTVTHNTIIAAHCIDAAHARGRRSLFAAGRVELIDQSVGKLHDAGITDIRVIQADRDEGPKDAMVTVASVQTLVTDRWQGCLPAADFLICDEAHHGSARTWSGLLGKYPHAHKLGLTATPERGDGKPLGDLFQSLVTGPSVSELIGLGHLVPIIVYPPKGGETLDPTQVALDPVKAYQQYGEGERAIVFCLNRVHAKIMCQEFLDAGIPTATVDGSMPARLRKETLRRHRCSELRVLTSIGVLTEGYDDPGVAVAILARGFGHAGLFLQCLGRILRPHPGKTKAIAIDLVGSSLEHGSPDWDGRTYSLSGKAINSVIKDQIRQCKTCGAIFPSGRSCPNGCTQEQMPFTPPTNTGIGLERANGPMAPKANKLPKGSVKQITSHRKGWCDACHGVIGIGDEILWVVGTGNATHKYCQGKL